MGLKTPGSLPWLDVQQLGDQDTALAADGLQLFYGDKQVLHDISLRIPKHRVTALIGPSGCGKSTLLRCFNRMNDLADNCRIDGELQLNGERISGAEIDVAALRRRVGMVFQRPNPFPKSIYENVVYGLRLQGIRERRVLDEAVERSLRAAALWHEVKDRLRKTPCGCPAASSSGW
ncbi:Phosphate import ATP-binding protein PstB 3 [Serratia rubidaea]|uniref:Phosphate import ATP-binding protein PstB 3 n=1 Tax=Serratia rubidaea TaxID=61652 RepID=A0A447QHB3_SERRU|nr:Phosphate import ATP-binding protein PstB 3 [Serratia rubidaea]